MLDETIKKLGLVISDKTIGMSFYNNIQIYKLELENKEIYLMECDTYGMKLPDGLVRVYAYEFDSINHKKSCSIVIHEEQCTLENIKKQIDLLLK